MIITPVSRNELGRMLAECELAERSYFLIQIAYPGSTHLNAAVKDEYLLRLWFHDCVKPGIDQPLPYRGMQLVLPMTKDQAYGTWQFLRMATIELGHRPDVIIVQCDAGQSRSAGVAEGLCSCYEIKPMFLQHTTPNSWCKCKIIEAFTNLEQEMP